LTAALFTCALLGLSACDTATLPFGGKRTTSHQQSDAPQPEQQGSQPVPSSKHGRNLPSLAKTGFGKSIQGAVVNHPELGLATAEIGVALADLDAANGAFRPAVSTGLDVSTRISSDKDRRGDSTNPYVRVSQLIYDGGASRHRRAAAAADLTRARDSRLSTTASVAMSAVEAHIDLVKAQKTVGLMQKNLSTHRAFLSQMQERRNAGAGSQSDLLTARSRFADAETEAVNAQADRDRARARYAEVFGHPPARAVSSAPQAPGLNETRAQTVENSPRMLTINAQIDAADARVAAVRSARAPRLEAGGNAIPNDGKVDVVFDFSIEYQFDTRRQSDAAIKNAEAERDALYAEKAILVRDITRALDFLRADRVAGRKRLDVASAAVRANRQNVDAARDEFSIGRATLLEVLDAQRDYTNARRRVIDAETEATRVGYQALALTGDIVDVFGIPQGE
jgi:adhesin transport system outer membrane protein